MSVDELARLAAQLSPAERLQLVEKIVHDLAAGPAAGRSWREIRGRATYLLVGEDAQAWISRSRQESDAQRPTP